MAYLVVRLIPEAPIDGATFTTYLAGLQLQVFDAYSDPPRPLSDIVYCSPLSFFQWPLGYSDSSQPFYASGSAVTNQGTAYDNGSSNYGNVLNFNSTAGMSIGSYVFTTDATGSAGPTISPSSNVQIVAVSKTTVTLNNPLGTYVPAGTVVSFIGNAFQDNASEPSPNAGQFTLPTSGTAQTIDGTAVSQTNPLLVLPFDSTAGIAVGMLVSGTDVNSTTVPVTTVAAVTANTVTLSQTLQGAAAAGTQITFTQNAPFASLTLVPKATAAGLDQLTFGTANGVAFGMVLNPLPGYIAPGTTVVSANATTVTVKPNLLAAVPAGQSVIFTFPLSSGIVQHLAEELNISFFDISIVAVPTAVATAIIPLNLPVPPPDYLNLTVAANRPNDKIPINTKFYNVQAQTSAPPDPSIYQLIPPDETSFYLTLPPQPGTTPIALEIPSDGAPPPFDALYAAMKTALTNDPVLGAVTAANTSALVASLGASTANCTRVAYDIVWSYQNNLPIPPDPLESLYTNPPNPGSSTQDSSNGTVFEQDRQKFEGTLNSFYATRNATAERLAKFVAAVSAAVYCEQTSLNAAAALLEFPVDPLGPSTSFANAVESEILLTGLGGTAANNINFGVPAAFFYALGAKMDKSTTAVQRYQMATGDAIDRLLQEFQAAEDASAISDKEEFTDPAMNGATITAYQAARRLVALGVSAASSSAAVALNPAAPAGSPNAALAALVQSWLGALDPSATNPPSPPPNPPLSYAQKDFQVWQTLAANTEGYLALDLFALTQGYQVPAVGPLADQIFSWLPSTTTPVTANPTVQTLVAVTAANWTTFFSNHTSWLPPFTQPVTPAVSQPQTPQKSGYTVARIRAFIRAVQKFFTVSSVPSTPRPWVPGAPPVFDVPANDPIGTAIGGASFGALSTGEMATEAGAVFTTAGAAQSWLNQLLTTVNSLTKLTQNVAAPAGYKLPQPGSLRFSVAEALFARGFRGAADIAKLTQGDFQQALTGTIAYDLAASLYQAAGGAASRPGSGNQGFVPINPDGTLTNCIPPPCLSPSGPAAYLKELLQLSEASTCAQPFAAPGAGQSTLNDALAARRGPLGMLLASCANVETRLPLIDIVNENLEYLGANAANAANTTGTVYATASEALAGYKIRQTDACAAAPDCFEAQALFAAMPEHSTPAVPGVANAAVEPAVFDILRSDVSTCALPYAQAEDVSRSYLRLLGSSRFDTQRHFRKCITEFALDAANPPDGFFSHLWRFPVRIETAIEYLGITPQEYSVLFNGTPASPCAAGDDRKGADGGGEDGSGEPVPPVLGAAPYGTIDQAAVVRAETVSVAEFLRLTCLSYCEFLELYDALIPPAPKEREPARPLYPACEPCCLQDYPLRLGESEAGAQLVAQLPIFVRLWRKLDQHCGARYSFTALRDICTVLGLFDAGGLNREFIRQLAAFQMLRDELQLPLCDPKNQVPGATGPDRTQLLALWAGSGAKGWNWAVAQLLDGVERYARRRFGHAAGVRQARLAEQLDALSRLAGFNPGTADLWHSSPACTLRFAEVLAKILTSGVKPPELVYLFNAELEGEARHWFADLDPDEAQIHPLDLPAHDEHHSLWALRRALLAEQVDEEAVQHWTWPRLIDQLRAHFGYAPPPGQELLLSLGQHFFPCALEAAGFSVSVAQRQYSVALTSAANWNTPAGPFHYDPTVGRLWLDLPLRDEAVAAQLGRMPTLNPAEQAAVSDLVFAPRADLGQLAFLFADWQAAERALIEEPDEHRRWWYFRRQLALAEARRRTIAAHLARHVASRSGTRHDNLSEVAALVLGHMLADENTGSPWEADAGTPPSVFWAAPAGGAVAALLALAGTGLQGEYEVAGQGGSAWQPVWRDVRGPMEAFGHQRDETASPVPTIIPSLGMALAGPPVTVQNGYASLPDGRRLGGAEGFRVRWAGTLLIEQEGEYAFHAGAPAGDGDLPDRHRAEDAQWRVTLQRGGKAMLVLNQQWPGETGQERRVPRLRRGAYRISVEFAQAAPDLAAPHPQPQRTGFQLKYAGPDSGDCPVTLPVSHLYRERQDTTLDSGIGFPQGSSKPQAFLQGFYTGSLRDIRRTYQRAFKAVLFSAGLGLSAQREAGQSELGYMLGNAAGFAGRAYYRTGANNFHAHLANFDFNFLPVEDAFYPPVGAAPTRAAPSLQRTQAMFDWWERLFDYGQVRAAAARHGKQHVWRLCQEAQAGNPPNAAILLNLIGAEAALAPLELRFYQDQTSPIYLVDSADLTDDRWLVRIWHAQAWLSALRRRFHADQMAHARPDLWVAADPAAPVPAVSTTETGNANLTRLVNAICLDTGIERLADLKRVNDGLRERGRDALLAFLCAPGRVALPFSPGKHATQPSDIAALLLLDVQTGICESASRIEEAITAVQNFIRRARLTLETWQVGRAFARLWDTRFATYHLWARSKRHELYAENWIEWEELGAARRGEAFRFLESELRGATLSLAAPGGTDWWLDDNASLEALPQLLQRREPSHLAPLSPPPGAATREGLATLGRAERAGEPSWLAAVPAPTPAAPPPLLGNGAQAAIAAAAAAPSLPLWMQAATALGTQFLRVAAASPPPAAQPFAPHPGGDAQCCDCRKVHPPLVDEYYFWLVPAEIYTDPDDSYDPSQTTPDPGFSGSYQFGLQDSFYDQTQQQSGAWQDETQVPQLLAKWQPRPAVRLAWCRLHNGQFGQPRKSQLALPVADAPSASDLICLGRVADSLYFAVSLPAPTPPPGYTDPSPAGFRYDLAGDCAVMLPEVLPAPPPPPFPGGLPAYPFYAYFEPGASLFSRHWFAPALAVADTLRAHCGFELALQWYARAFNPLQSDCTWMDCSDGDETPPAPQQIAERAYQIWELHGRPAAEETEDWIEAERELQPNIIAVAGNTEQIIGGGACCDSAAVSKQAARQRTLTLRFCETLVEWGDLLIRRGSSGEALQQARLLYDTAAQVTGRRPQSVQLQPPAAAQPVANFTPAYAPLNPRLLDLYAKVEDRQEMLRGCLDAWRLRSGGDSDYFGNDPLRDGWRSAVTCADEFEWCQRASPYRFVYLIQKATELAGRVRELGNALLAAYEKGDAEYLASLRAGQERELLALGLSIRQDQWRDADWQVQVLQQTKDVSQTNLLYYTGLYQNGLLNDEIQNISLATNAMQMRTSANITEAFGEAMKVIPDIFVGFCSSDTQVPVGTKLAGVFETIAKVMMTVADVQAETAAIDMTEAGWQRRSNEWFHQTLVLPIEIQQVELQILGAQRRRDQAMQELNNQQRQIENAGEVLDFLRDKFTASDLYLWMQQETAALYRQMYELAHRTALQAQHAFNLERGHTTRRFLPDWAWDDLHAGLLAGERLEAALHHMETAYLDENVREYELAKQFSLRLQFPMAFLRLRATGRCEIDIPEWMFDLDYPGHYMRRIRNVTMTVPCVTGPYTGVHCRLTLLGNVTRIDPCLAAPVHGCCCPPKPCGCDTEAAARYRLCPDDPRMVKIFGARDAIATSGGQNDSGLFELNFSDPRYLPFEFMGAVSRWRIELPPENNYFDLNTLTDTILHLNYTAREGGELLRNAARAASRGRLPGDGWAFFDLRHDFPDAWELFHRKAACEDGRRDLAPVLRRKFFPYLPGNPAVRVTRLMLLFETVELPDLPATVQDCCCPQTGAFGAHEVSLRAGEAGGTLICSAAAEWPRLYSGMAELALPPFGKSNESIGLSFGFKEDIGEIARAYLFLRYEPWEACDFASSDVFKTATEAARYPVAGQNGSR